MLISIEQQIKYNSIKYPQKKAIVSGKKYVTYLQLWNNILAAKQYFESLPLYKKKENIILAAGKQISFAYAYFGAHLAGLTVVPIDPEVNSHRLNFIINSVQPILIVGFDNIETHIFKESLNFFDNLVTTTPYENDSYPEMDDIADIIFTTGTTGVPKGVLLTHNNEAAAVRNINTYIGNTTDDIELLALPISHSFGLGRLRCNLSIGATIFLLGSFVNLKKLFRTIEEEHITGFSMVPASWKFIQKMSGNQLAQYASQIKYIEMGSAYFSTEDKCELAGLLPNTRIMMHYGLTEASRSAFMEFHEDKTYLGSVGKASPFTDIQIFNEQGKLLPCNDEGEICIKGEHVTKGYINIPSTECFWGDYFRTGDWGKKNEFDYIFLKSRKKDLINVGGKKVSPIEIEEQLLSISGILDCACIAIPDPNEILGEVVKAFIVKDQASNITIEIINKRLIDKLESYKIPVEYVWIDSIPKTPNGKVQRGLLK